MAVNVDSSYLANVDAQLDRVLRTYRPSTFAELLSCLRGAPPDLVWPLLGRKRQAELYRQSTENSTGLSYEPHALDYDWAFAPETASQLAALVATSGKRIAAFGAPSVHNILCQSGRPCTLVDRNPIVSPLEPILRFDLCGRISWPSKFDTVVLDAPWYPEVLLAWLHQAFAVTCNTGEIFFSLWGELTRPAALQERNEILELLSLFGRVTVHIDALLYESPLFERRALRAAGIPVDGRWRRGDLVHVQKRGSATLSRPNLRRTSEWHRFVFGRQQLAVRVPSKDHRNRMPILAPRTLPSISRSHEGRDAVDIWTSDNTVARIDDPRRLLRALENLAVRNLRDLDHDSVCILQDVGIRDVSGTGILTWRHHEWTVQQ